MTAWGCGDVGRRGHGAAGERQQPTGVPGVSGSQLTNEDNLIAGFGLIHDLSFTNNGTVSGDVSGQTLRLGGTTTGTGTYTTANGGILQLEGVVTGGTFDGVGVRSTEGTLINSTNAGTITVAEGFGNYLRLVGTIQNSGLLTLETGGDNRIVADDSVGVPARLTGGGTVRLASDDSRLESLGVGGSQLTNEDNLIAGFGLIHNLAFTNNGTVSGDVSGETLRLGGTSTGSGTYTTAQRGYPATRRLVTGGTFDGVGVRSTTGTLMNSTNSGTITVAEGLRQLPAAGGDDSKQRAATLETGGDDRIVADDNFGPATLAGESTVRWRATTAGWSHRCWRQRLNQ